MTDQTTEARDYPAPSGTGATGVTPAAPTGAPEVSAGVGWVRFGAVVMVIVGIFGVIEGLAAVLTPTYFVSPTGVVFVASWGTWGWVHLIVGALVALVGTALLGEAPSWARGTAVALVAISAILHLIIIPVAPVWSIVVIALDIVVIWALVTTWHQPVGTR